MLNQFGFEKISEEIIEILVSNNSYIIQEITGHGPDLDCDKTIRFFIREKYKLLTGEIRHKEIFSSRRFERADDFNFFIKYCLLFIVDNIDFSITIRDCACYYNYDNFTARQNSGYDIEQIIDTSFEYDARKEIAG